jgi:hypothetical protein
MHDPFPSGASLAPVFRPLTMKISITRRAFLSRLTIIAATAGMRARALRIALRGISRTPIDQRSMGLSLGVDEATHAASLFGGVIEIVSHDAKDVSAIIASTCDTPAPREVLTLNVACASDELRRQCHAMLFHVAPSDAMRRDAVAHRSGAASAWHASLTRFGADTLNQRFLRRYGEPMTEDAWTAWMAVKVLWESSLRTRAVNSGALAAYLSNASTQFDGHKGRPLSFRAWDHQLRQPLYVVDGERVSEMPTATASDSSTRAVLDQLGARASETSCVR